MKPVDKKKNPGLASLPTEVRNKMGFMKRGGAVKKKLKEKTCWQNGWRHDEKKMSRGGRTNKMGGGMMKKRMKRGGKA